MKLLVVLVWLLCGGGLAACAATPPPPPLEDGPPVHSVVVASNGWHTAIIVSRPGVAATGLLPEVDDFPDALFLEFGWGDRTYYPAKDPTVGMALGAALTPTPAVMHMAGRTYAPVTDPENPNLVLVRLTQDGFEHMIRAIAGEFTRPEGGVRAVSIAPGLYGDSKFYDAESTFHLFNTCNTWTARMLRTGGVNLPASGIITADDLMARLREAVAAD